MAMKMGRKTGLYYLVGSLLVLFILATAIVGSKVSKKRLVEGFSGSISGSGVDIPRKIWTYWDSPDMPEIVQNCIEGWKRLHPDYEVTVITPENAYQKIPMSMMLPGFRDMPPYRQSDWARVALLSFYGGYWLDASIILTERLDWIQELLQREKKQCLMFSYSGFVTDPQYPTIENWFIAAPPRSNFVNAWLHEVENVLRTKKGDEKAYLKELEEKIGSDDYKNILIQNVSDPVYLVMYIAAAKVIYIDKIPGVTTLIAQDNAWKVQDLYRWDTAATASWIFTGNGGQNWRETNGSDPCEGMEWPPLIKLRSQDRGAIAEYSGPITEGSVAQKVLGYETRE